MSNASAMDRAKRHSQGSSLSSKPNAPHFKSFKMQLEYLLKIQNGQRRFHKKQATKKLILAANYKGQSARKQKIVLS